MKSRANIKRLIIGAGNILLSDEGIGIHILKELEKSAAEATGNLKRPGDKMPGAGENDAGIFAYTSFVDIGTSSIDIGLYLCGSIEKLVIIDCIKANGYNPGTVFKLGIDDLRKRQKESFSLHQMELVDNLKIQSIISTIPDTLILGIVPYDTDSFSMDLSETLKETFPEIISKVKSQIKEFFKENA
jgi:hydrogenase maturation protease